MPRSHILCITCLLFLAEIGVSATEHDDKKRATGGGGGGKEEETCAPSWTGGKPFTKADIPMIAEDERPKFAAVTGGCSGLGLATASLLAEKGWSVILGCRRGGEAAVRSLKTSLPAAPLAQHRFLDNADFSSVRAFAASFQNTPLHLLINNAAVSMVPFDVSMNGVEVTWQTNFLSHFLLTLSLLPSLREAAAQCGEARIVNLGSEAHRWGPEDGAVTDYSVLHNRSLYSSASQLWGWYGHSKQAMQLFTLALAHRLQGERVFVNSVHPGLLGPATGLLRQCESGGCFPPFFSVLGQAGHLAALPFYRSSASAATAVLFPATSPVISQEGVRGQWIVPVRTWLFPRWLAVVSMWLGRLLDSSDPPVLPHGILVEPWMTRDLVYPAPGIPSPAASNLEYAERLWTFSAKLAQMDWKSP